MAVTPPNLNSDTLLAQAVELAEQQRRLRAISEQVAPRDTVVALFGSEAAFRRQLLDALMTRVRGEMLSAVEGLDAGNTRVVSGLNAYLDAQLKRPVIRELMQVLKEVDGGTDYIRGRIAGFNYLIAAELKSISWPNPELTARLLAAAVIEAATIEFECGKRLDDLRGIFADYLHAR